MSSFNGNSQRAAYPSSYHIININGKIVDLQVRIRDFGIIAAGRKLKVTLKILFKFNFLYLLLTIWHPN